jgi:hypothetical protein
MVRPHVQDHGFGSGFNFGHTKGNYRLKDFRLTTQIIEYAQTLSKVRLGEYCSESMD